MQTKTYTVNGMTCGHCVNSVDAEVGRIPGVTDVQVDLAGGTVTVTRTRMKPTIRSVALTRPGIRRSRRRLGRPPGRSRSGW